MAGFFFTGEENLTPSAIDRKRALINALAKENLSTAPVGHWTQALARVLGSAADNYQEGRLNAAEKTATDKWTALAMSALGQGGFGGGGVSPAVAPTAAAGASPPSAPAAAPPPASEMPTDGTPMPPIRPASLGGQATGIPDAFGGLGNTALAFAPFAAPASPNGQPSDQELAIRTIAAETSGNPQETQAIAAVIANRLKTGKWGNSLSDVVLATNQFEPWNKPGGANDPMRIDPNSPRYQMAQQALAAALAGNDPTNGATHFFAPGAQAALGRNAPSWAQGGGQRIGATAFYAPEGRVQGGAIQSALGSGQPVSVPPGAPPGTPPAQINPMPDTPAPAAAQAQFNVPGQAAGNPRTGALLAALSSPWAAKNPMLAGVAQKVLGEQLTGNKLTYQTLPDGTILALDPSGRRPPVPVYQAPVRPQFGVIGEDEFGNKRYGFINPMSQSVTPYSGPQPPAISGAPAGASSGSAPAGGIPPAPPGVNPKVWRDEQTKKLVNPDKLTEAQSKDVGFYTRGVPANDALTKLENDLIDKGDVAASKVPLVGNMLVSGKFQKAQNAARDFLAVILRKDTGAAVTPSEFDTYGQIFLPAAGDGPEVIQQKREARVRALEGIRIGLGSVKDIVEYARPKAAPPAAPSAPQATPPAGRIRRYNPQTQKFEDVQ